jgi:signal transduction histidine kinase
MTGKALSWTAAQLRTAASPGDVHATMEEARSQLGDTAVPGASVLPLLEELALEAVRLRTELRSATRLREALLASVAHDLRNPLNTFAMSCGLLRDDLEGPDLDRTRALSFVGRMDRATSRMQALIEDLLEASRVESGAVELTRRPVQAAAVVRAAIAKAKPVCSDKGASLEEGAIDEEASAVVDRAHTTEALIRLIGVSLRATGEGGVLRLGVERADGETQFTIRGAASRGGASMPPPDEGRGGLAFLIGRGLMAAQGGQLRIESTQEGVRVVVAFPTKG